MLFWTILITYVLPIVFGLFSINKTSATYSSIEDVIQIGAYNKGRVGLQYLSSNNTIFTLFSPTSSANGYPLETGNEENLKNSPLDYSQPIKCIIHGWGSSGDDSKIVAVRDAYVNTPKVNVIVVSWYPPLSSECTLAVQTAREVGKNLGQLLEFISNIANVPLLNFHVIGHSFGAHVAGFAGKYLNGNLGRITGLDVAAFCFEKPFLADYPDRLAISDANHVDALHTCGGYLGFHQPLAHIDYFLNGGSPPMPGCTSNILTCSHERALEYWRDEIIYPNSFIAVLCDRWCNYENGKCENNPTVIMGDESSTTMGGNFYLRTNAASPFGQNTN